VEEKRNEEENVEGGNGQVSEHGDKPVKHVDKGGDEKEKKKEKAQNENEKDLEKEPAKESGGEGKDSASMSPSERKKEARRKVALLATSRSLLSHSRFPALIQRSERKRTRASSGPAAAGTSPSPTTTSTASSSSASPLLIASLVRWFVLASCEEGKECVQLPVHVISLMLTRSSGNLATNTD
jgi:hypothetical protein